MKSKLAELHKRLMRLKRYRQRLRWGTAYSAVALAVLWVLAAALLVDWLFEMDVYQRAIALALYAGLTIWAFRRYAIPWLGKRESELDVALLVERQSHIDTDLTAAVQFEWPEAPEWGSVELEQAVIDQVVGTTPKLNVAEPVPRQYFSRRFAFLMVTVVLWGIVAFLFPQHITTFFRRLVLGPDHYPTRTVIRSIVVNGREVDPARPAATRIGARYGAPLKFQVVCEGDIPEAGEARLRATQSGLQTTVNLASQSDAPGRFTGELPRLLETVRYQLYFGDAWTDRAYLSVTVLPNVDVILEVIPPQYYEQEEVKPTLVPANLRQVSVAEGSQVVVHLRSDKKLTKAVCTLDKEDMPLKLDEQAETSPQVQSWILDPAGTALANMVEPARYEIQVTDDEEQQLEQPFLGVIRVQPDAPPRVAAAVITRFVLPTARPRIYYRAMDDHGVAKLLLVREVVRANGQAKEDEVEMYAAPKNQPPERTLDNSNNPYRMDLSPLELKKGDQVKITVRAVDFRGRREGKSALSEPFVFQVTDEEGVLAAMTETDRQSAERLDIMIQRQLGIGEPQ